MTILLQLPKELWLCIFQYIDLSHLNYIALVSNEFNELATLEKIIRLLHYHRTFSQLNHFHNHSSSWLENSGLILIVSHHVDSGLLTAYRLECIGFNVLKGTLEFVMDGYIFKIMNRILKNIVKHAWVYGFQR